MNSTFIADFKHSVERYSQKTAVSMEDTSLSYAELDARTNQVAHGLMEAGVGPADIVTVHMKRSIEAVCAVVGILKAGAAFCVIDTQYPEERRQFIQKDTGARVQIDEHWMAALAASDGEVEAAEPGEEAPALVVYTSGSTGMPKGVVNPHGTLKLAYSGFAVGRSENDVLMSVASFSFVAGALEILVPLYLGATLIIADDEVRRDGVLLSKFIHEKGVTSTFLPPQMARFVLPRVEDQLVSLFVGSDRVRGLYSNKVHVYNTYGASETCGPMTRFAIDHPCAGEVPVGKPFAGSHIYVVDDQGRQVPNGETGEIWVAGQVASGYLNLPELTKERFVTNPFSDGADDAVAFRTNDLGRLDEDGNLVFVQRRDWMIKVRGYRVEPTEVEQAIMRVAPVREAVVQGFENAAGEMSLFAVYTADTPVDSRQIGQAVREFLPEYMIPAVMEQVDALPVNANGKVDRRSIEVPKEARFRAPYQAPETDLERRIVEVFEKVLHVPDVGVEDDFNLLGGDSQLAAQVQCELEDLKISTADILSLGTPRALAKLQAPRLEKASARSTWPLTFAERQMAAEQGMHPESVSYNINSQGLRIRGPFDAERMQRALDALVARHPILRSYYPMEHGEYVHKVKEDLRVPLERIECTAQKTSELADELNAPFDLAEAPLFRAHLFVHGEDDVTLHFTFHHIIMDGTSWRAFVSDLFALYNGVDLPELPLDYFDHAVFQEAHAETAPGEAAFKEMFADGLPETEMPTVAIRPDVLPPATCSISERVPLEPIARAARRFGVTKYELMMAALGMTLGKYTGTEDVVVGTAMSGRTMAEQESMIGMFVNTLPVRMKPIGDMHVSEHILRTANTIREVKKHQTYPIERLTPLLAPDRNASRSPLFDIIFNYLQKEPVPETAEAVIEPAEFRRQALAIDLMLEALVEDDCIHFLLSYSKDLYDEAVPRNFMEQFLTILRRLDEGDENARVEDAAELPDEQRRQILEDFAGKRTDANKGRTVTELFRKQAKETPDGRAVVFGGRSVTYGELDALTDRLAAHLASLGLGRGKVAGIMVSRGLMMPIAALGVLKTGAAYLPLDPAYPADRLEYMIGDAGADLIVADSDLMDRVPDFKGTWVKTEDIESLPEAAALPEGPQCGDLFILLYTSGTTGKPKGVMLRHENLTNFLEYYTREYALTPADNIPAYASFGFDACMMDMYPTLTSGACLHIIPEEMRLDLPGLRQYFEDNGITVAFMTTQLGRQFAERDAKKPFRALSIGGESLTPIEPPESFAFYNIYGPTECTIIVTRFHVDRLYDRVPIGRALDNTSLYVFDSRGHLAPVGVAGELGIAGRQVSSGYLNRPDLTAEKFVPNPYSDDPDYARMYKTGDVVRFLPSGDIDFVGRRDFQVKIRGFRVELTEIEGRIREFPHIQDATVIAQEDAGGGKRIVAYIVADEVVDIPALNAFIAEKLPVYMVPAATMQIDRIPLNPNGKVDKRKLPKVTIQAEEIVAPRSELEQQLKDIVAEILGSDEFGVNTDLMYAGLNSLSSIKAAALITERTGRRLSTAELMREKTIERLARLLENSETYEMKTFEKRDAYPLTQNQLGLYFAIVKDPASLVYNIPFELVLSPKTDVDRLRDSLVRVVEAHPYVKTHLTMQGSTPVQVRNDTAPVEIRVEHGSQEEYEKAKAAFVRPFNFFEGPLYDMEIFVTPEHVYLLLDFHHIIFDGGSMDIFLRDLEKAYAGEEVPEETFTSFDLALSEQERGAGAVEEARSFYAERLSDGEGATSIAPDKGGEGGNPRTVRAALRKNAVMDAIKGLGITASNLFLAATGLVTGRFASTDDVRIASITNGREGVEVQNNLGMLVETLPTVIRPLGELTVGTYLANVQQEMLAILQHRAYSYLQASSEFGYNAQILYAYQGGVLTEHSLEDEPFEMRAFGIDRAKFPISVNIQEDDQYFTVEAEYDDAVFAKDTMTAFSQCIAHMAQVLAGAQDARLGDLSICTPEQREVLEGFNRPVEPVKGTSLFQYFERWASHTPDAPALVAADRSYTFRELNETANRLAHALISQGVVRGDKVAFMLPRTGNVLVAMLGIMKTGAAYIPIDPEYPRERIEHILEDSAARFLLTDGVRELSGSLDLHALLEETDTSNPNVPVRQDDLCYIIYTSGSTGKPKGVMIEHRNIMNYVTNVPENIPDWALTSRDCSMVSVTTVSFDMFLKEAFTTLMNGRRLILADDAQSKNPDLLAALFEATGGDAFNATPSRMLQYMELPEIREALSKCRVIMAGGEGYPAKLYEKLRRTTDAELINTYGPTEITVSCNAKVLDSPHITIGKPLYGVVEQVMDICGHPLPAGVTGELWIGGNGVGRGYLGKPEMTAERFVEWNGRRWYRSGDLARWTEDGEIRILGRNDGQIKLRGLRIELGEIEGALLQVPGIESGVVLVQNIHGQEHLAAYYTAQEELPAVQVRDALSASLTKYMVPTAYMQLPALPMTPNGKVDRRNLPQAQLMRRDEYVAPTNEREQAYAEIFAQILGLDQVGITDSFFDLGGTSLLVTQVTIDAAERGYKISYGDVFANPTPKELAALETSEGGAAQDDVSDYDYAPIERMLEENTIDALIRGEQRALGNVCITGTTGFLGIHVLREYLRSEKGTAYCIVRGKTPEEAKTRLQSMLVYYFSDSFDDLFGSRIQVVPGDVTSPEVFDRLLSYPIDTFINCAANVKHFSAGTDIEDVNVGGVRNAIAFCEKKGCRFIQISTASTAGMSVDDSVDENMRMTEQMLYFGQDLGNKYTHSKFLAERETLEAALRGLDAKIMRVGNLMAREEDGEFQANFKTNNFLGRLNAYSLIGNIPYEDLGINAEFAPIDYTARAILALAQTPPENRVFHPYNDHSVYFADVIAMLREIGVDIEAVEKEAYERAYSDAMHDRKKARHLNSLIAYQETGREVRPVKTSNTHTSQALLRLGFMWPITTPDYLRNFFVMMDGLGFFDNDEE